MQWSFTFLRNFNAIVIHKTITVTQQYGANYYNAFKGSNNYITVITLT